MIVCQTKGRRRSPSDPWLKLLAGVTSNIHEGSVSQCKHMQAKHAVNVYKSALLTGSQEVEAFSHAVSVGGSSEQSSRHPKDCGSLKAQLEHSAKSSKNAL